MKLHHSKPVIKQMKSVGELLEYHYQLEAKRKSLSYEYWKDIAWIRNFYSLYQKHIDKLLTKISELNTKYYISVDGVITNPETLLPGMKEEDYNAELKPFLNEMVEVR